MARAILALPLLGLATACAPAPDPVEPDAPIPAYDPANPVPWCAEASKLLGNPYLDEGQRMFLYENMRSAGCFSLASGR